MIRGAALERAIANACDHYRRAGRAEISKQHVLWHHGPRSTAPIDFSGSVSATRMLAAYPVVIEAKEHDGASWPLNESTLSSAQVAALDRQVAAGVTAYLVLDMTRAREVFRIEWTALQAFLRAPWRHSIPLHWLHAHALLCPVLGLRDERCRTVLFLEAEPHPLQGIGAVATAADKGRAGGKLVELYPNEIERAHAKGAGAARRYGARWRRR